MYVITNASASTSNDLNATSEDTARRRKVLTVIQITCYSIIVALGTVGNFMLIFSLISKRHRKRSEYFIMNLASVDLLSCSLSVPFDIILIAIGGGWPFGSFMCRIVYPLQTLFMAVSVATLLCMALERYRAILHPLKPKFKGKVIAGGIVAIWLISATLVSPYAASLESKDGTCAENWPDDNPNYPKTFTLCVFLILYVSPLCVITVAYTAVGKRLHVDTNRVKLLFGAKNGGNIAKFRAKRNVRVVKFFVFAVIAFAICLLPFQVMWMWSDFGNGQSWKHFDIALTFANVMVYANSAVNPFIFGALGRRYNALKCCYRKKRQPHTQGWQWRFVFFRFEGKNQGRSGVEARTIKTSQGSLVEFPATKKKRVNGVNGKEKLLGKRATYSQIRETEV